MCPLFLRFLIHSYCNQMMRIKWNSAISCSFDVLVMVLDNEEYYHHCYSMFIWMSSLVVFSFFEKTTYCCRTRRLSVRLSVCPSVRPSVRLSVRPSVEIISFRGNSLPNMPIELKIGLNVREGVVHVRKAWFFEILIASCKFMQFAIFCK